jgi:hypothetical protein
MRRNEDGNLVIEASIVLTLTGVFIVVLINLGLILYQRALADVAANDAATRVAHVYAFTHRDPFYAYLNETEFRKTDLYRYVGNIFTNNLDNTSSRKAEWFGYYRLRKGAVLQTEPTVTAEVIGKPGVLLTKQVVVTIEVDYSIPFTVIWGGNNRTTYTAVGKADCFDIIDYINMVDMAVDFVDDLTKQFKFFGQFNKILSFFTG